jgi:DNA mismatch repair protein MutS2
MPAPLQHTYSRVLEFDTLREVLRAYAHSPLGHARITALAPTADRSWIERQQQLVAEVREYLRAGSRFDFSGLVDPSKLLDQARIEGVALEASAIRQVLAVVDRAAEWLEIALHPPSSMKPPQLAEHESQSAGTPWPAVAALSTGIVDFTDFLHSFRNKINPDGTLDDRASPELARIRREVDKQKRVIHDSLRSYVGRLAEGGVAQEELVTIRGERFVIPHQGGAEAPSRWRGPRYEFQRPDRIYRAARNHRAEQ